MGGALNTTARSLMSDQILTCHQNGKQSENKPLASANAQAMVDAASSGQS